MFGSIAIQALPRTEKEDIFNKVDKVIEYIASTGLNYVVGPFETTVEGDFDQLMEIIRKTHEILLEENIGVSCYIKTSFTPAGDGWTIEDKTKKYNK